MLTEPAAAERVVASLASDQGRTAGLISPTATWQQVLSDGVQDLVADVEHDLQGRLRTVLRDVEAIIDAGDPKDSWARHRGLAAPPRRGRRRRELRPARRPHPRARRGRRRTRSTWTPAPRCWSTPAVRRRISTRQPGVRGEPFGARRQARADDDGDPHGAVRADGAVRHRRQPAGRRGRRAADRPAGRRDRPEDHPRREEAADRAPPAAGEVRRPPVRRGGRLHHEQGGQGRAAPHPAAAPRRLPVAGHDAAPLVDERPGGGAQRDAALRPGAAGPGRAARTPRPAGSTRSARRSPSSPSRRRPPARERRGRG